jgi:hypothetical protein
MAFIVSIDRGRRQAAFRLGIGHVFEIWLLVPGTAHVFVLRKIEHELDRLVGRNVSEEWIVQLAHRVQRLHEHIGVGDLTREKVVQGLLSAFVIAGLDEGFVGLASSALRRDICSEIANHVAAFLDIGCRPAAALAVEEVWAAAFELK